MVAASDRHLPFEQLTSVINPLVICSLSLSTLSFAKNEFLNWPGRMPNDADYFPATYVPRVLRGRSIGIQYDIA